LKLSSGTRCRGGNSGIADFQLPISNCRLPIGNSWFHSLYSMMNRQMRFLQLLKLAIGNHLKLAMKS